MYVLCNKYYIHTYIHTPFRGGMYVCMYVVCTTKNTADAREAQLWLQFPAKRNKFCNSRFLKIEQLLAATN